MAEAEVGDDVFGEDPTINRLEETVASMLGKESALFVPTGVMANQLAIKCHSQPGEEVIVERESHIFLYETGAPSLLSGVMLNTVKGDRGILDPDTVRKSVRADVYYLPRTSLVCLENTHNKAGGTIYPIECIAAIRAVTSKMGIPLHLDGARLWNACAATGLAPHVYAGHFDTVSVCFSKGLGAPVGSALTGPKELISRARKFRKIFGGGMRQAGIIAAGALYALEHNISRLSEDHEKARRLAVLLAEVPGMKIDLSTVQSNIVIIDVAESQISAGEIIRKARSVGVLLSDMSATTLRGVTHLDVSMEQVEQAGMLLREILT